MNISIIVAIARNHGIGFENKLLYWLPNDLKRFKALTTGHTIIMGRKTFESLPKGALPNRRNIVLSRREGAAFAGAECFPSLEIALSHEQFLPELSGTIVPVGVTDTGHAENLLPDRTEHSGAPVVCHIGVRRLP